MKKAPGHINDVIDEYLSAPELRERSDVKQFKECFFRRVDSDPRAALSGFGPVLETSLYEVIEKRWLEKHPPEKGRKGKQKPGLGDFIKFFEESFEGVYEKVFIYLHNLRAWRNFYSHRRPTPSSGEDAAYDAQTCALELLHFLVWKYECWEKGRPGDAPRSGRDKHLLLWGVAEAVEAGSRLADAAAARRRERDQRPLDAWGVASVKARVHALAEVVAYEAAFNAEAGASVHPLAAFQQLVPVICELRWRRGYLLALRRILKVPKATKRIGDFTCIEAEGAPEIQTGIVSAESHAEGGVLVRVEGRPTLLVKDIPREEMQAVLDSLNGHGRLGLGRNRAQTLRERIEEIEFRPPVETKDPVAECLFRNREALVPLIVRHGMPGSDWLLRARSGPRRVSENIPAGEGSDPKAEPADGGAQGRKVVSETFRPGRRTDAEAVYEKRTKERMPPSLSPEEIFSNVQKMFERHRQEWGDIEWPDDK